MKPSDDGSCSDNRNQDARHPLVVLEQQDDDQRAKSDSECDPICLSVEDGISDCPEVAQRALALNGKPEELWQLADQNSQCNAVHVAVADWLGEKFGHKAEAQKARQNEHCP